MIFLFLLSMACNRNYADQDCATIEQTLDKERCYSKQLKELSGEDISKVIDIAKKMEDPIIKGEAVEGWIKTHVNAINQRKGQELCALLDGRAMSYCQRQLSSPHLKR